MRLLAEDLDWLLDQVHIRRGTQMRRVMVLRHVEGLTDPQIAAEMGLAATSVRSYASRAWAKVDALADSCTRDEHCHQLIQLILERDPEHAAGETIRQHAAGLLQSMRGHRRHNPSSHERDPTKAGPVVNVDDVVRVVRDEALYRDELASVRFVSQPVEAERLGPYRGETVGPNGRPLQGC